MGSSPPCWICFDLIDGIPTMWSRNHPKAVQIFVEIANIIFFSFS